MRQWAYPRIPPPIDRSVAVAVSDGKDAEVNEPELTDHTQTTTAVIRAVVPMAEIADFFDRSFAELASALQAQGMTPTGAAFARYTGPPGATVDVEVGFPTDGTVVPTGEVHPGSLPGGRVARLVHTGGYDGLGEAWGRLATWIQDQGLTPGDASWEVYATEPSPTMDPADLRTELVWPVR